MRNAENEESQCRVGDYSEDELQFFMLADFIRVNEGSIVGVDDEG